MDPLIGILSQLGVGISSQAIYDVVKTFITRGPTTVGDLSQGLVREFPSMTLQGCAVVAQTVVDFFAEKGFVCIVGSSIRAGDAVWMRSAPGTKIVFGSGSDSKTDKTRITAGYGAEIQLGNGAQIRQNPDGSIDFRV